MELSDFEGKHEGEEVIVVCNGPGLKNIPFAFLQSRTNFVLNFFPEWARWFPADYWVVLDPLCFRGAEYLDGDTVAFVKAHQGQEFQGACEKHNIEFNGDRTVFYQIRDRIPEFIFTEKWGLKYSTSAIAASHIGVKMGASKILLVGFDCTYGIGLYQDIENFKGISRIPHWYDKRYHFSGYSQMWDEHFKNFAVWAKERGVEIINLSIPTRSKMLESGNYHDYWQPEEE